MSRIEEHGHLPPPSALLAELDRGARASAQRTKTEALAIARSGAPGSFSGPNMMGSVRRRPNGYEIVIQVRPKLRWRAVFPEGGTGRFGPKGKPIRRRARTTLGRTKPFVLPSGARVKEIPGQRAQHFMRNNRAKAASTASRALTEGGRAAAGAIR